VKLVVEESESSALIGALQGRRPYLTSVVGEIEIVRACRRANVPPGQVDQLQEGLVILALDDEVGRLAAEIGQPTLRTIDAVHLATALSLRDDLDEFVTYDVRLAAAAQDAGLAVVAPS
jgi:predicted nucleic acid-binding protein